MTALPADARFLVEADSLPFGVIVFDAAGKALRVNAAWTRLTGQTQEQARSDDGWLQVIVANDRHNAELQVKTALAGDAPTCDRLATAAVAPAPAAVGSRPGRGRPGRRRARRSATASIEDSDEEHNRGTRLEYQATHDGLTGVLNRAQFVQQTRHALSRLIRHPGTLGLVFIDLDEFKEVNDQYGHVFGDRVLAAQAQRFPRAVRPNDIVARYGGDEFVVLCEDLGSTGRGTRRRGAASRSICRGRTNSDGLTIELHASVGVVTTNDPYADLTTLLEHADLAMYRAKQRGRDCVELESLDRDAGRA